HHVLGLGGFLHLVGCDHLGDRAVAGLLDVRGHGVAVTPAAATAAAATAASPAGAPGALLLVVGWLVGRHEGTGGALVLLVLVARGGRRSGREGGAGQRRDLLVGQFLEPDVLADAVIL